MKNWKSISLLSIVFFFGYVANAQFTRYLVKFKDKGNSTFTIGNPSLYLSQRAIERRNRFSIAIDSTDLPVTQSYLDAVASAGEIQILNASKWLNQVSIQTNDINAINAISNLPFVESVGPIASKLSNHPVNKLLNPFPETPASTEKSQNTTSDFYNYGRSNGQVKIHRADFLHNHGFHGEGMQMAVIDDGFFKYDILPTFDSIRANNQILGTWDFVAGNNSVAEDDSHGMKCLSTIAANMPGIFVGTAPKTSFYLFRSEDANSEYPIEEHNFSVAAERADSLGVDICSTSLGYATFDEPSFDHTYADLDGNTTMAAIAADLAAKKGMLMVFAAGNEGTNSWHYIITPADADSVFAIGAVDTLSRIASFSSYGPSSDGQIKPAVASVGLNAVVANTSSGLPSYGSGTSFACPNMAGVTTCLWQAFPEAGNMDVISTLQLCGTKPESPDDRIGYGIPDVKKAFVMLQKKYFTLDAFFNDCNANINISIKTDSTMHIDLERKFPSDTVYSLLSSLHSNEVYGMHDFSYIDDLYNTDNNFVQYRLKMTIGADTTFFIDSVTVNYSNSCLPPPPPPIITENAVKIFPNPVLKNLFVKIDRVSNTKIGIVIHNTSGQLVYSNTYQQETGSNTEAIDLSTLAKGIYIVSVYTDDKKEMTKKIVKL